MVKFWVSSNEAVNLKTLGLNLMLLLPQCFSFAVVLFNLKMSLLIGRSGSKNISVIKKGHQYYLNVSAEANDA